MSRERCSTTNSALTGQRSLLLTFFVVQNAKMSGAGMELWELHIAFWTVIYLDGSESTDDV